MNNENSSCGRSQSVKSAVLCVDLDGTLLKTDTLYECFVEVLRSRPSFLIRFPFLIMQGRYRVKQALTQHVGQRIRIGTYPRNPAVEDLIAEAKAAGKKVELITAADQSLMDCDPALGQTFDAIIGSSEQTYLVAEAKADFLRNRHPDGFAYIGNSPADLPVWRIARERFAVNISKAVRRHAASEGISLVELGRSNHATAFIKSLRLHQWLKNLLVFVPFGLILSSAGPELFLTFIAAFLLLGLLTSGTYLFNDIMDVTADRKHPSKRLRPIASGDLPIPIAAVASVALIFSALSGAALLNLAFAVILFIYLNLTIAYSLILKRIPLIDVLVIATLFTLRIVAGMTLVGSPPSEWLLTFAVFFFLSLAMMKRAVELDVIDRRGVRSLRGRGYSSSDRTFIVTFGLASGVASLVIFSLFVSAMVIDPSGSYASPEFLWGIMPVLSYWIMRMWLMTTRGLMNDDPILYAARARFSLIAAAVVAALAVAAQLVRL